MQVLTLDQWPYAVRYLLASAQDLADARGNEVMSPAHVNAVLFAMRPSREAVGAKVTENAIDVALMVEKKSAGRTASFTKGLLDAVTTAPSATTVEFLRRYATNHPTAAKVGLVFAAHAETIAPFLEAPDWTELMQAAKPDDPRGGFLGLGVLNAVRLKHREVQTRHVVLAAMAATSRVLEKRQLETLEGPILALEEIIARGVRVNDGDPRKLRMAPKLAGIMASLIARGEGQLRSHLHLECLKDDPALESTATAFGDALARLRATPAASS